MEDRNFEVNTNIHRLYGTFCIHVYLYFFSHGACLQAVEADWLGLTLEEAVARQVALEDLPSQPLKHEFRAQLLQYLHQKHDQQPDQLTDTPSHEKRGLVRYEG